MSASGKEKEHKDHKDQNQITAAGSVSAVGQRFRFAAGGLWAGTAVAFVAEIVVGRMDNFAGKGDIFWLLGVAIGGMLATAVMHGRLADNRTELGRVRDELDRKAKEYSLLLGKVLKHPRSSKGGRKDDD